jgi:hypothetical protein
MTYTVNIPQSRAALTDAAIESWLDKHPADTVDDAIGAIFAIGVHVQLAIKEEDGTPWY